MGLRVSWKLGIGDTAQYGGWGISSGKLPNLALKSVHFEAFQQDEDRHFSYRILDSGIIIDHSLHGTAELL